MSEAISQNSGTKKRTRKPTKYHVDKLTEDEIK